MSKPKQLTLQEKKGKNKYFDKVIDALYQVGIVTIDDFLEILGNKNRGTVFSKNWGYVNDDKIDMPFKTIHVKQLCFISGLSPHEFLIDEEIERDFLKYGPLDKADFFTRKTWAKIKKCHQLKNESPTIDLKIISKDKENNPSLEAAYDDLTGLVLSTNKKIDVHELLFKGNNNDPGKQIAYTKSQEKIFDAIQNVLEEKKGKKEPFKYSRTFYLSPNQHIHPKSTERERYNAFICEISFIGLRHIIYCMTNFPKMCHFNIAPVARFRSHSFLDDCLLLTEDYVKNKDSIVPRLIFLDDLKKGNSLANLIDSIQKDNEAEEILPLKKAHLKLHFDAAMTYIGEHMNEKEKTIEILEEVLKKEEFFSINIQKLRELEFSYRHLLEKQLRHLSKKQPLFDHFK